MVAVAAHEGTVECDASAVVQQLATLVHEVRELRKAVGRLERRFEESQRPRRRRLTPDDRALLAQLLPRIAGAFGSSCFRIHELFLQPTIAPIILAVPGSDDAARAMRVGKLFARVDAPLDGFAMVRAGREDGTCLWSLVQVTCE